MQKLVITKVLQHLKKDHAMECVIFWMDKNGVLWCSSNVDKKKESEILRRGKQFV